MFASLLLALAHASLSQAKIADIMKERRLSVRAFSFESLSHKSVEIASEVDKDTMESYSRGDAFECKGLNTIRNAKGECDCLPGFPYGDPTNAYGCWKCNDECHTNAQCVSPGKCKCIKGYIGDGVHACDIPVPHVKALNPENVTRKSESVNVIFETETNFSAFSGFCRIGTTITLGEVISADTIQCQIPPAKQEVLSVAISFDNTTWSTEKHFLVFTDFDGRKNIVMVWQVWLVIAVAVVAIAIYIATRKHKEAAAVQENPDERVAFNPTKPRPGIDDIEDPVIE